MLTELILENVLAGFEPEEIVALLSAFVFQEKTDQSPTLTPKLEQVSGRVESVHRTSSIHPTKAVIARGGIPSSLLPSGSTTFRRSIR